MGAVVAFVAPAAATRACWRCGGMRRAGAAAARVARTAAGGAAERNGAPRSWASRGKAPDGPRFCVATGRRPPSRSGAGFRLLTAVARQGFELCGLRERPTQAAEQQGERTLEPLLPGFICASAAMARVADQIQRVQGQTLTVLITGESGTGKDLIARAIHAGSPRRTDVPAVQLHDDDARARRQPAVRAPARQLHRRDDRSAGPHPVGGRRHAVPRRDRRRAARRAAASSCASSNRARSCRSARRGRWPWTCGCWPPPTPTSSSAWPRASSARISTTASASSASRCRRCGRGARRFRTSARSSCARRARGSPSPKCTLSSATLDVLRAITGRATCGSCATRFSAPWR